MLLVVEAMPLSYEFTKQCIWCMTVTAYPCSLDCHTFDDVGTDHADKSIPPASSSSTLLDAGTATQAPMVESAYNVLGGRDVFGLLG